MKQECQRSPGLGLVTGGVGLSFGFGLGLGELTGGVTTGRLVSRVVAKA